MEELEVWFERELAPYGFSLTPTMYNPENFSPMRGILYAHPDNNGQNRIRKLRIQITPQLTNDLQGWGRTYENEVDDYREMVIDEIMRELITYGYPNPFVHKPIRFTPTKKITKFKFI